MKKLSDIMFWSYPEQTPGVLQNYGIDSNNLNLIGEDSFKRAFLNEDGKVILLVRDISQFKRELEILNKLWYIGIPTLLYLSWEIINSIPKPGWIIATAKKCRKVMPSEVDMVRDEIRKKWAPLIRKKGLAIRDLQVLMSDRGPVAHDPLEIDGCIETVRAYIMIDDDGVKSVPMGLGAEYDL